MLLKVRDEKYQKEDDIERDKDRVLAEDLEKRYLKCEEME